MKDFFSATEKESISNAIGAAEKLTSGEIRLFVEAGCKGDTLDRAAFVFEQLGMQKTKLRNGILFYLAYRDHKFAILGDVGINIHYGDNFWEEIKKNMEQFFAAGKFCEGIMVGVAQAGEALAKHFPPLGDNPDELSNAVVMGN